MALNPRYVTAPGLQEYYVDKVTGEPLAGGRIYYYRDTNRTEYKSVFSLQGNTANYTYVPLPNPVILSSVGTVQDNNRNDIKPYYYPLDENGDIDLYFIRVYNSAGVHQFDRQAWPNPNIDNQPSSSDDRFNYIPNGQLLAHTDLPENALLPGSNIIAQGGFTIELDDDATSVNTLEFIDEQFTQAPPQSPRYVMQFTCSTFNPLEEVKNIRIKWTDVNKFSTKPGEYRFAFWASSNVALPISIELVKFFGTGGTPFVPVTQDLAIITTAVDATLYQFTIDFGINAGYAVDEVNQDDYVALDISLPTNIGFVAQFSDFVLVEGDTVVTNFPVQTDADMMARGVFGWADKINPNGFDLYLPPILTKRGMTWDASQICTIGMDVFPIDDPNTFREHNKMPCDGATYIASEFAANGIPFARLGNQLLFRNQALNDLPVYGTGANFVSTLVPFSGASATTTRIVYNTPGAGSVLASEGANTNITFAPMYLYNGVTTGRATLGVFSSNMGTATVSLIPNAGFAITAAANGGGGSTFVVTQINSSVALRSFQLPENSYSIVTPTGVSMVGGTGRYFTFTVSGQPYFVWFNVAGGNGAPAPGGIGIEVRIAADYTAQDVADVTREALNAFNATQLTMPAPLPGQINGIQAGSHFLFSSNPGAIRNFYVWFTVEGVGNDPEVAGATGIQVNLFDDDDQTDVRDRIRGTINRYQYAAPDFRGMFFRAADPNATWDLDAASRWSTVGHMWGIIPGTFEYQQFLSHTHQQYNGGIYAEPILGSLAGGGPTVGEKDNVSTNQSGGSETRPVNTYIYPFIRY